MSVTYNNVPERNLKIAKYHYLHVFTDHQDFYFDILKLGRPEARKQAFIKKDKLLVQGNTNIRIYDIQEEEDYRDGNIEELVNDCIFSVGSFPY